MCLCACVCMCEGKKERVRVRVCVSVCKCAYAHVRVCMSAGEFVRERETERETERRATCARTYLLAGPALAVSWPKSSRAFKWPDRVAGLVGSKSSMIRSFMCMCIERQMKNEGTGL